MAGAWSAMDPLAALSSDESSSSEDEGEENPSSKSVSVLEEDRKEEGKKGLDYEALSRHGYTGGLSIMNVPAPVAEAGEQDWSWSHGNNKRKGGEGEVGESIDHRERTRETVSEVAEVAATKALAAYNFAKKQKTDAIAEQRALSFSQKEKRKREMGQASRGKNYVEEEKRLLRDQGVYSGFDT
jgi:hypothetical protein